MTYASPMKLKIERPLAFIDIESTGANWRTDRIIDLAVVKLFPDGRAERRVFRMNPDMPIPPESTRIHGIADADVQASPRFADTAGEIEAELEGCDLAGYNLGRFDIPMLQMEFSRLKRKFNMDGRRVVDVQRIFHRREPRDLSAAVRFYCGGEHAGAHGALADSEATWNVLEGQLERYPDLPTDVAGLAEYTSTASGEAIDPQGRLAWDGDGDAVLNFGIYKGRKLKLMAEREPTYLEWMLRKEFGPEVVEAVRESLNGRAPRRPETR
jgi:DNA polymerase-3 subunit epsilon